MATDLRQLEINLYSIKKVNAYITDLFQCGQRPQQDLRQVKINLYSIIQKVSMHISINNLMPIDGPIYAADCSAVKPSRKDGV